MVDSTNQLTHSRRQHVSHDQGQGSPKEFGPIKSWLIQFNKRTEKKATKLSTKAQKVLDVIIEQDFGCNRNKVINLMSVVLGETLALPQRGGEIPEDGIIVTVLGERDGHQYKVGQTYMVVVDDHMMDTDGDVKNHIFDYKDTWRLASQAEVKAFVETMGLKAMRIANLVINDHEQNCDSTPELDEEMDFESETPTKDELALLAKTPKLVTPKK